MAIPITTTSSLQSSVAIYFNQAIQGFAAASEAALLTQMSGVKVKNSTVSDGDEKKFYKKQLKELYPNGIDKQALVDLMEANTGIDLSPAEEAQLVGLKKPEQIIKAFLDRQDVRAEFNGDVLDYQQDLAAGTAEFGSDSDLKNAAPTDITPNTASVAETVAAGSVITTLAAVDPDAGDTFTFQLITDASGKFEIVGNQLKLKAGESVDFETAPSHAVTVQVTDQDGETYQEVLTINVTNVGNAPTDITPNNAAVAEDISSTTTIMTLSVVDPGPEFPGVHTWTLVDDPSGLFEIIGNEVSLKAGASLDFETATSHDIKVKVTDPEGLTYEETLTINVTNVQDGNTVNLQVGTDTINTTNDATNDNDTFVGSTNFSQAFAFGPINIDASSTARNGDKIDGGDDDGDVFDLTLSGNVASFFDDVVSNGIETNNVEILRVHNQVTGAFGENVIVDMSQHHDVVDVELPLPDSDIMLRDMQNAGGTILIQDPSLGDEMDVQIDFDLQALNGVGHDNDTLTIQVEEVNGADILITQDAEGNGGEFGDGVAAALETLTVDFVNIDSRIDELRSNGTSTFFFTGDANAAIGDGLPAIDLFGANPGYTSADSFFDDMGNTASLIDASDMTGSLYINLSEASNDFDFLGGTGADTTVIGNSLVTGFGSSTFDGGTGADNTAVLWDEFSVTGIATDNPLVNYQRVAFTEAMGVSPGGLFNAAFMGQQVRDILLMDGLSDGGFGLTVTNTDALPPGTIFHFQDELPPLISNFPADDDGEDAEANGETMTFLTSGAAAATVSVHWDDFSLFSDEITFAGNVGVMNLGGSGALISGVEATFVDGMDNLTTINATGNNQFELLSTGVLNSLATIDATGNTGGVEMQNSGLLDVFSEADHTAVSDINSGVLGLTLTGGDGDDVFIGSAGNDVINGNGNNDVLFGNAGIDIINGGDGNDSVQGGDDTDFITGGLGNDDLVGGDGDDFIDGNEGEDTLYGWAGNDDLDGGAQNDLVKGGGGEDIVRGGLGVDEHWGDRDTSDLDDPEGGPILGNPETSTITIDNVEPGDSFAVTVSGIEGQGPVLVVYAATAIDDEASVAAALEALLDAALVGVANVSVVGNVVSIQSLQNGDAFEVATVTTNVPAIADIETLTFADADTLDIGDSIDVTIDGTTYTVDIEALLADAEETAAYVAAALALVVPANITVTSSGDVLTVTNPDGTVDIGLAVTVNDGATPDYITLQVSDFEAGEQVQVEVLGGNNHTANSLLDLADAVINDGAWQGTGPDLIIPISDQEVRIYSNGLAAGDLFNLGVLGGDGGAGTPGIPVITAGVVADGDGDPAVTDVQTGVQAGVDDQEAVVDETVAAAADQDLTDDNTGFFSDTFVIETGTGPLVVSATASDDGAPGTGDDVVTTDADALSSMDRIMDWDAGSVDDFLNFAALNVDGDINNYTESDGATSLLDAIASINFMLSTGRDFAAAEVFLANAVTENQTAATAGSDLSLGAGTYHTIVGADTNGDNIADQMVILVGVGSAGAGVDGFTQTDIVQV